MKWETYTKKIQIEARVMGDLSMNHIIPIATHYQSMLVKNVQNMRSIFPAEKADKLSERNIKLIEEIAERTQSIENGVDELIAARKVANKIENEHDKAIAYHDTVAPKMEEIRYQIDKLELIVEDDLWTLPKYRELLFIRSLYGITHRQSISFFGCLKFATGNGCEAVPRFCMLVFPFYRPQIGTD